ncbi:class I SAM-dependent DNA methyltransferase, partial [Candidatus Poribacteria bacterium]|nr:class I SAM-dependent DNA methyltransferase [Candidatus Poribacteria bacterium]
QLLDMGPDVFDATVDTNILLFQNTIVDNSTGFRAVSLGADFDKQTGSIARYLSDNGSTMEMPAKGEPWAILSSAELALKRKIEDIGKPLKDWDIKISFGIKTGCNEAFIIDEAKREELIDQDPKSAEVIKPLLRGRDIERYHAQSVKSYLLATNYDLNIPKRYPAIHTHLETIGEQIESGEIKARGKGLLNRDDQGENWWNLRACAYYAEFDKEKVVWKRIGSILRFAYIQHPMFCLDSTCIATGEKVKFLNAVLNSRVSHYQLFDLAPKTGTGDLIVSVQALEPLLVPTITKANEHLVTEIENKVDKILDAKHTDPDADTSAFEDEIDKLVYELYNLTEDEIAIVEGSA